MKTLKTYGVYGMVEKTIILKHKGVELKVPFTGGSANTNGIIPAKFTTANPAFQYIIEQSKLFELKNIKLIRSVNVPEEGDDKPKQAPVSVKAVKEAAVHEVKETEDGYTEVTVTDIQSDGRQYLIKECGLKANEVRTKQQIEKAASDLGIRFIVK